MNKIGVLIVAPNASSRFGGEAFLPLKYFELLRRRGYPAQLIAHSRNRDDLSEFLAEWIDDVHFVEDSRWHKALWLVSKRMPARIGDYVMGNILNFVNEIYQARIIRRLVGEGTVDVIHQPIPVSPRAPSSIHGFGVPVIIGPMNGGMCFPPGYEDYEGRLARSMVSAGRLLAIGINWLVPGKRKAAILMVANERTRRALPTRHRKVVELVENGVDLATFNRQAEAPKPGDRRALRLVHVGRLVGWKAVDVTLRAVARARAANVDVTLDILGDGEERAGLELLMKELGLVEAVRFHGFVSQKECASALSAADALILNSLYECGGAVVLEAMSLGLPVIAPDWGGPADYLDDDCGILVSPTPRADFPQRLSHAIERLAADPELRRSMGKFGAEKVRKHYDWERKLDRMIEYYREAISDG